MKTIFTTIAVFAALSCFGQLEQGQKFLKGYVSIGSQRHVSEAKYTRFWSSISGGYLLTDRFAVGGSLGYSGDISDANGGANYLNHGNIYTMALFARQYLQLDDNFYVFGQGHVDAGLHKWFKRTYGLTSNLYEGQTYRTSMLIGASYFAGDKVSLEVIFGGVEVLRIIQADGKKSWDITSGFNILNNVNVGASIYFHKLFKK